MTATLTSEDSTRPLAAITGASRGIGYELARRCAAHGFDLLIGADESGIYTAAQSLRAAGATVEAVEADLATRGGVDQFYAASRGRPVAALALLASAGRGLGRAFLDQHFEDLRRVIDTNVSGTTYLLHKIGGDMRARREGRILITGSIAGFMPGSFNAAYNGTKAYLDSLSSALRDELEDSGVTVTCLMPDPTDTDFFERADMLDTTPATGKKADPIEVARIGFDAMMNGEGDVVAAWKNELQAAGVAPASLLAAQHRKMAKRGSAAKH